MKKLISLCMIVKNEEPVLSRCLNSVKDLVDEMIIVDTGSTDATREIAQQYNARVFDFQWANDFAAARNESIRHATGQWIFVLDADEYLDSTVHTSLRNDLERISCSQNNPMALVLPIHNFTGKEADSSQIMVSTGARLFTNFSNVYYTNPIHEQLTVSTGSIKFKDLNYPIYHDGYTQARVQAQNKSERNLGILESQKTAEKLRDPYYCFTLANEYVNANRLEEALPLYRASFAASKPNHTWYAHVLDSLISTELRLQNYPEAYDLITKAIKQYSHIADYHCYLGLLYDQIGFFNDAISSFERAIQLTEAASVQNKPYWSVHPTYGTTVPFQMLGMINHKLWKKNDAVRNWVKNLQLQPKNYTILSHLVELLIRNEKDDDIIRLFQSIYPKQAAMEEAALFHIALQTGSRGLSQHYYKRLKITISTNDKLMYHLLNSAAKPELTEPGNTIKPAVALAASMIYNDVTYCSLSESSASLCMELWKHYQHSLSDSEYRPELSTGAAKLLSDGLFLMKKYQYTDLYYLLLQTLADSNTINHLALELYHHNSIDEAIDLFSLLLDHDSLSPEGMKAVGQWQMLRNTPNDGFIFLKDSLKNSPSYDLIGWVRTFGSNEQYNSFLSDYLKQYPHMKHLKCL